MQDLGLLINSAHIVSNVGQRSSLKEAHRAIFTEEKRGICVWVDTRGFTTKLSFSICFHHHSVKLRIDKDVNNWCLLLLTYIPGQMM